MRLGVLAIVAGIMAGGCTPQPAPMSSSAVRTFSVNVGDAPSPLVPIPYADQAHFSPQDREAFVTSCLKSAHGTNIVNAEELCRCDAQLSEIYVSREEFLQIISQGMEGRPDADVWNSHPVMHRVVAMCLRQQMKRPSS